jgi:hypothetical protein
VSRSRRRSETGLFRGCCFGVVLLLVALGLLAFVVDRAVAAPDLGAGAAGPSHGGDESQIAVALATQLAAELASNPQAVISLSEMDLSVLANQNRPSRFSSLEARIRNGQVVISGPTNEGPFTVTAVAYVSISLNTTTSPPQFSANVTRLDIGQIEVPGIIRDVLLHDSEPGISMSNLFAEVALRAAEADVECLRVTTTAVVIGVHRPGVTPDPSVCAAEGG